eukprot:CAMPEP_0174855604 /NCGR_PEP_ID=MMETSP1114-20130205/33685_1 /TAXON_ID=312471 /ORGANISM="Neobodo designis, Strain CCAP 1951/1" /LENGTH=137 /DNA_ID=CAMNT_0016090349 /DNA_START=88 /DNA_END=498 /DNA_ORIENTATION=+
MLRATIVRYADVMYTRNNKAAVRDRPVITRTRSWRGLMQVRHDDTLHDYKFVARQLFFWSPLRVFGMAMVTAVVSYLILGHDGFMYHLFGYESEGAMEHREMNKPMYGIGALLLVDRHANKGIRKLEEPLEEQPKFN